MDEVSSGKPSRCLSVLDAVAITVGIVIGAFIFSAPSFVAANTSSPWQFVSLWVLGGLISLVGALCYAELAVTYPDCGGDYHFLHRAYGPNLAFMFAWARLAIIQTGSIALQAFVIGDYASNVFNLGAYSSAIYAAGVVLLLTGLNIAGLRQGKWTQVILTTVEVLGVLLLIAAGFWIFGRGGGAPRVGANAVVGASQLGLAMVFVLLTYGGWNEAAYLSAEVRGKRGIVTALLLSIGIVTVVYVLANVALMLGLGLPAMANTNTVAADLLGKAFGPAAAGVISLMVVVAAASTTNATIFTGARTNYALGRDFPLLGRLGRWDERGNTPTAGLVAQAVITLALVVFAAATNGLRTMVDYITPVFWFFFLMVGASLFVLRHRDRDCPRPFRAPLYPLTPILFCLACGYMLWSSVSYALQKDLMTDWLGGAVGIGVLLAGVPLMLFARRSRPIDSPRGFEPVLGKG